MITEVEDFFAKGCGRCARFATPDCSVRHWSDGVRALRRICLAAGLVETAKWGHPCYVHAGRNIALIAALRGDFRLNFFNAALMTDPEGLLERQGTNSQNPDSIRFTDNADVLQREGLLRRYLAEAMDYAERGLKPEKPAATLTLPSELQAALEADAELARAFAALTPGRQKSWVLHLTSTQTPATRIARIARGRDKILSGKGATER